MKSTHAPAKVAEEPIVPLSLSPLRQTRSAARGRQWKTACDKSNQVFLKVMPLRSLRVCGEPGFQKGPSQNTLDITRTFEYPLV